MAGAVSGASPEVAVTTRLKPRAASTAGEYHCLSCGYGIMVRKQLPLECPMCRERGWVRTSWRPFTREPGREQFPEACSGDAGV